MESFRETVLVIRGKHRTRWFHPRENSPTLRLVRAIHRDREIIRQQDILARQVISLLSSARHRASKHLSNLIHRKDGSESKYDPAEIRISTASNAERWLPGPLLVRGHLREYFNELALWQDLDNGAYSVYLK